MCRAMFVRVGVVVLAASMLGCATPQDWENLKTIRQVGITRVALPNVTVSRILQPASEPQAEPAASFTNTFKLILPQTVAAPQYAAKWTEQLAKDAFEPARAAFEQAYSLPLDPWSLKAFRKLVEPDIDGYVRLDAVFESPWSHPIPAIVPPPTAPDDYVGTISNLDTAHSKWILHRWKFIIEVAAETSPANPNEAFYTFYTHVYLQWRSKAGSSNKEYAGPRENVDVEQQRRLKRQFEELILTRYQAELKRRLGTENIRIDRGGGNVEARYQ